MPGYEQKGGLPFSFAAQRNYLALYLLDPEVVQKCSPVEVHGGASAPVIRCRCVFDRRERRG